MQEKLGREIKFSQKLHRDIFASSPQSSAVALSDMFEDEGDIFDGPFSEAFQKLSYSSDNRDNQTITQNLLIDKSNSGSY